MLLSHIFILYALITFQQSCVTQFTSGNSIGGCGSLDAKCICSNADFLSNIACCLANACDQADQQSAVTFAKQFCTTQGVTVPNAVVCNSASGSSGASSTPASSVSVASSAAPATSSVASAGSSVVASNTASVATVSSTSSAAATVTNAATHNGAAGLSFVGGLAAAIVLL